MDELISRQAAIDLWEKYHPTIAVDAMQYDAELMQLPSVDAVPVRRGEWVPVEADVPYGVLVECSKCGSRIMINDALEHKYCSECGARMDGKGGDGNG